MPKKTPQIDPTGGNTQTLPKGGMMILTPHDATFKANGIVRFIGGMIWPNRIWIKEVWGCWGTQTTQEKDTIITMVGLNKDLDPAAEWEARISLLTAQDEPELNVSAWFRRFREINSSLRSLRRV